MIEELIYAIDYEKDRKESQFQMKLSRKIRDNFIFDTFEKGVRQKEIANALGLSESTIKHIIAKQKEIKS